MQFMWMGEGGGDQILLIDTFYIDLRGPSIELLGTLFFVDSDREGWVKGTTRKIKSNCKVTLVSHFPSFLSFP